MYRRRLLPSAQPIDMKITQGDFNLMTRPSLHSVDQNCSLSLFVSFLAPSRPMSEKVSLFIAPSAVAVAVAVFSISVDIENEFMTKRHFKGEK